MIAHAEDIERAVGAEKQARSVEAGAKLLRLQAILVARKARLEPVGDAFEARLAEADADDVGTSETSRADRS